MPRAARLLPLIAVLFAAACALPRHHAKPVPEGAILFDSAQAHVALTCAGAYLAERGYVVQNNSRPPIADRGIRGTREASGSGDGYTADVISVFVVSIADSPNMWLGSLVQSRDYASRGNLATYTLREPARPDAVAVASTVRTACSPAQ